MDKKQINTLAFEMLRYTLESAKIIALELEIANYNNDLNLHIVQRTKANMIIAATKIHSILAILEGNETLSGYSAFFEQNIVAMIDKTYADLGGK